MESSGNRWKVTVLGDRGQRGRCPSRAIQTLFALAFVVLVSWAFAERQGAKMEKAVFAAGCFWGVEAIFQELDGVVDTTVGYTGGRTDNPTYKEICHKDTGHAEAIEIVYDPAKVSYEKLLAYFWRLHDPTTVNRQGPDIGSQYRSAIFYYTPEQKAAAETVKAEAQKKWKKPIVTEIVEGGTFHPAEDYHQDYFKKRGGHHTGCHYLRD